MSIGRHLGDVSGGRALRATATAADGSEYPIRKVNQAQRRVESQASRALRYAIGMEIDVKDTGARSKHRLGSSFF